MSNYYIVIKNTFKNGRINGYFYGIYLKDKQGSDTNQHSASGGYVIDNVTISYICLYSKDDKKNIRIVLPYDKDLLKTDNLKSHPKLFLFYPLIGTESNGLNFIITFLLLIIYSLLYKILKFTLILSD